MTDTLDIIFCELPYSDVDQVYSAPAILKSIVIANGYTSKSRDFGVELFKMCGSDPVYFNRLQQYFMSPGDPLDAEQRALLDKFYDSMILFFKENPSKYIGFSIFSYLTHKCTLELITRLKSEGIDSKIVVGGRGAKSVAYSSVRTAMNIKGMEKINPYGQVLKDRGLVDYVVLGDGEDAILDVLRNNVKEQEYRAETFQYPIPDYSDYNFNDYLWKNGEVSFPITGSRGCVRKCDFCDIGEHFGKYKFRSGQDVAREMLMIQKEYGFSKFQFTDSLVNGGLRPLEEFCTVIAEHNEKNPDLKIKWNGQYICRESRFMPERLYDLMSRSGAEGITIGAESGSDHVLEAMDKKTTAGALLDELEMFRKYNITAVLLMFVGHWRETHEDFVEHCRFLTKLLPYFRSGTLSAVSLGVTAGVLDGTPSMKDVESGDIIRSEFDREWVWFAKYNPTNTYKERIWRRLVASRICRELGYPIDNELAHLGDISQRLKLNSDKINEFFREVLERV
jgi:hypothetical protein